VRGRKIPKLLGSNMTYSYLLTLPFSIKLNLLQVLITCFAQGATEKEKYGVLIG
jgi:hypothetical protein